MRKKNILMVSIIIAASLLSVKAQNIIHNDKGYMFGDRIVVKFANVTLNKSADIPTAFTKAFENFGIVSIEKRFKLKKTIAKANIPLNKIAVLKYASPLNPEFLSRKISKLKGIEWAEPYYLDELMYVPNDPSYSSQYGLKNIQAELAWDVTKGDSSIIVAIDDTGVDWDHPDLAANIWVNAGEIDGNGIDDDNNGYIDDVRGWDFGGTSGTPDNDPMEDRSDHGTHVAGIVSAVTDNGAGIASIGYNTTIMPVKTAQDDIRADNGQALIAYGYSGIIYAVDNGASVVNCSWGSYNYSIAAQEVIDYAVKKGALVVGAAGNENVSEVIYPGAYRGALSVGSVNPADVRSTFSNYGKFVDVMAPGTSIYSTWQDNVYTSLSGTSMASPLVAGLAALVYDVFPNYTPEQIAEQIRATCDNVDSVNSSVVTFIGSGRINAYRAVTETATKSVRLMSITFADEGDGDGILEPGEQVGVTAKFKNFLNPLSSLSITFESKSAYATVLNGGFSPGAVGTLQEFDNSSSKFIFTISDSAPENAELDFFISYSENGLNGFDWASVSVNPTYRTQSGNMISVTLTSRGTIGFNDYPENIQGDGFSFDSSPNLLFEGALIYGTSETKIANAARDNTGDLSDDDFSVIAQFVLSVPGVVADQQGLSVFDDTNAGASGLGIETEMRSYSFANSPDDNYVILRYIFRNNSGADINGMRAGLYFDWDIDESTYDDNVTDYDSTGGFGYAYSSSMSSQSMYLACALLSSGDYSFYGIENGDARKSRINVYDGFSDQEKWTSLSKGTSITQAGPTDISYVAGGGPLNIAAGDSAEVAFAIIGAYNIADLRTAAENAKNKYDGFVTSVNGGKEVNPPEKFALFQNYPNPFNPATSIKYNVPSLVNNLSSLVNLSIYDVLGRKIATLVNKELTPGSYSVTFDAGSLSSGVYYYRLAVFAGSSANSSKLNAETFVEVKKMMLLK